MASGIPTTYKGVRFRSRLEARWATMFDSLQWPWVYEPLDLEGYIPDFVLTFKDPVLVEIKPALKVADFKSEESKLLKTSWEHDFLFLGALFPFHHYYDDFPLVGSMTSRSWLGDNFVDAAMFNCRECKQVHVFTMAGCYGCRGCGEPGGSDHHLGRAGLEKIHDLWAAAGNTVQWKR